MKRIIAGGLVALIMGCSSPQKRPAPPTEPEVSVKHHLIEPQVYQASRLDFPPIDKFETKETDETLRALEVLYVHSLRFSIAVNAATPNNGLQPAKPLYRQFARLLMPIKRRLYSIWTDKDGEEDRLNKNEVNYYFRILKKSALNKPIRNRHQRLHDPNASHELIDSAIAYFTTRQQADLSHPDWLLKNAPILSKCFVRKGYWQEQ